MNKPLWLAEWLLKQERNFKLRLLAHLLRHHDFYQPHVKFNIFSWGTKSVCNKVTCEMAACAVGSACVWKPFNLLGLTVVEGNLVIGQIVPKYKNSYNWVAVREFFKLTNASRLDYLPEEDYLFSGSAYRNRDYTTRKVTRDEVIEHINLFIKHDGIPPNVN